MADIRFPTSPSRIGRCAVAGCTNSARIVVRVTPGPSPHSAHAAATGLVCAHHARYTELGAVLCGATAQPLDPAPNVG